MIWKASGTLASVGSCLLFALAYLQMAAVSEVAGPHPGYGPYPGYGPSGPQFTPVQPSIKAGPNGARTPDGTTVPGPGRINDQLRSYSNVGVFWAYFIAGAAVLVVLAVVARCYAVHRPTDPRQMIANDPWVPAHLNDPAPAPAGVPPAPAAAPDHTANAREAIWSKPAPDTHFH